MAGQTRGMTMSSIRGVHAVLFALLLGACSEPPPPQSTDAGTVGGDAGSSGELTMDEPMKAGSRLAVRVDRAEGGAYQHLGFYDTQLGANCTFRRVGDAAPQYRCLTVRAYVAFAYRDAACTDRVALVRSSPLRPAEGDLAFATERNWAGCHGMWDTFRVGAEITPAQLFQLDSGGDCLPTTPHATERVHELSPGSDEAFVAGTEHVVSFANGLEAVYVVGEDGSAAFDSLREGGETCSVEQMGDGYRCASRLAYSRGTLYADSACGGTLVASVTDFSPRCGATVHAPPQRVHRIEMDEHGCSASFVGLFAVGARHDRAWNAESACMEVSYPLTSYYELGGALSADALPQVELVDVGSGRLRVRHYAAPDGTVFNGQSAWHDESLGVGCEPTETADGAIRCLPGSLQGLELFSDAACSAPVIGRPSSPCGDSLPEAALIRTSVDADDRVTKIHALEPWSGSVYRANGSGGCIEDERFADWDYYQLGAERPLDGYALIERIDPGAP